MSITLRCLYFLTAIFFTSCTSNNSREYVSIDVDGVYREKELNLKNIAKIEYIQLETDESFLFTRHPSVISANNFVCMNRYNGDILFFSKDGKPLYKFNHKGEGVEEYSFIFQMLYDEHLDELFVRTGGKILIYSSKGVFKRSISLPVGAQIKDMSFGDDSSLIIYDSNAISPFSYISKTNGEIIYEVRFPAGNRVNLNIMNIDQMNVFVISSYVFYITRYKMGFLLTDHSNDTVYFCSKDKVLSPFLRKTPSVINMDPVIYMNSLIEAGDYQFFTVTTVKNIENRLPISYLMRDTRSGRIYQQKIRVDDYIDKEIFLSPSSIDITDDDRLAFVEFDLEELKMANHENKLRGKLKEIVNSSIEDGNNIYMLLTLRQ